MARIFLGIVLSFTILGCGPSEQGPTGPVVSKVVACDTAKRGLAELRQIPVSSIAFCEGALADNTQDGYDADGFYVLKLAGGEPCTGPCSNLMGWFAVDSLSGEVFAYDMANLEVGPPLQPAE